MRLESLPTKHLLLLSLAAAWVCQLTMAANEIGACEGKSIYIMDLGMFAEEQGIPQCSYTVCLPACPAIAPSVLVARHTSPAIGTQHSKKSNAQSANC